MDEQEIADVRERNEARRRAGQHGRCWDCDTLPDLDSCADIDRLLRHIEELESKLDYLHWTVR